MEAKTLWVRRLIQALLDFANGDAPLALTPGVVRGPDGLPRLKISEVPNFDDVFLDTRALLVSLVEPDGHVRVAEYLNASGGVRLSVFDGGAKEIPALLVPRVDRAQSLTDAVLGLALVTPTPHGDPLAARIARCVQCQRWWLRRTRRPARFHTPRCRWKWATDQRRRRGAIARPSPPFPTTTTTTPTKG